MHVKVWKTRLSPVAFHLEGGAGGTVEPESMNPQTKTGKWEDMVWDFSDKTGVYTVIGLQPDKIDPVGLTDDITIYFDDIYVNNSPVPGSPPVQVLENFETIPLNYMLNGAADNSSMLLVENPDKSGVNSSDYCIKFLRDKDGSPWDGFWSKISDYSQPLDITTNKFVHVKVWKPRISPVFFKIEGGSGDPTYIEKPSDAPQTKNGQWEDIVWDFSAMPATTYPIISLQPDREDPVTLTDDIIMYFDDIILNNDPKPTIAVTLNVDMTAALPAAGVKVYIAGNNFGNWAKPGDNPANEMTDANADGIYTITLVGAPTGDYAFKFFKGAGWDGGEWVGDPNRTITITEVQL
jgi:hypothetical protein